MHTFEDNHGVNCILQDDTSLDKGKTLRIGVECPTVDVDGELYDLREMLDYCKVNHQMHLSKDDVKKILPALIHFVEFGEVAESLQGIGKAEQLSLVTNLMQLLFPKTKISITGK